MWNGRFQLPLLRGQCREFKLRDVSTRSRAEVRTVLARGTALVERVLRAHATRTSGVLPADWLERVQRRQIMGDGERIPELVNYAYEGVAVLDVWTYIEHDVLHVLVRRAEGYSRKVPGKYVPARTQGLFWSANASGSIATGFQVARG